MRADGQANTVPCEPTGPAPRPSPAHRFRTRVAPRSRPAITAAATHCSLRRDLSCVPATGPVAGSEHASNHVRARVRTSEPNRRPASGAAASSTCHCPRARLRKLVPLPRRLPRLAGRTKSRHHSLGRLHRQTGAPAIHARTSACTSARLCSSPTLESTLQRPLQSFSLHICIIADALWSVAPRPGVCQPPAIRSCLRCYPPVHCCCEDCSPSAARITTWSGGRGLS